MSKSNRIHQGKQRKTTSEVILPAITEKEKETILPVTLAFFIPVLLNLQTLAFGFTHFDDDGIILNNLSFLSDFKNASQVFVRDAFIVKISPFYRPLQSLSYMVDIKLSGGNNAWMYHLSNVLLLGFIACLLFQILKRFAIQPGIALLSTLIYCTHPLFVSSVAWIPARGDLLLMLFSLLSFLLFIDYLRKRKIIFLLLHWVTFTIALFCKETAALLPFLFLINYLSFSSGKKFEKKYWLNIILYAVSGIGWYWLRSKSIGDFTNRTDVFGFNAVLPNLRTIPESLFMFFLPFDIPVIPGFSNLKTIIGSGILVLIFFFIFYKSERSKKEKVFCVAWFLLLIIPTMLFKHVLIDYLSHRFFLPLTGILLFVLLILPKEWTRKKNKKVSMTMIGIFIVFSALTLFNSRAYSNLTSFYNAAIERNPRSAISYNNRGFDKVHKNDFQGAIADFNKAIEININYDMAYNNRGYSKSNIGDTIGAMEDFKSAININNKFGEPYFNSGNINYGLGRFKDAIDDFTHYIALRPNAAEVYNSRGMAQGSSGNFQEAITDFNKAIEINPNYPQAYGNRSIARYTLKDLKGALADCEKVLELNPGNQNASILKVKIQQELGDGK